MKIKISDIIVDKDTIKVINIKRLINSIRLAGQLNPIIIRKNKNGKYVLLDGHHRLTAMKKLGYSEIDSIIKR